jgi:GTPase SAR1 family protein
MHDDQMDGMNPAKVRCTEKSRENSRFSLQNGMLKLVVLGGAKVGKSTLVSTRLYMI